MQELNFCSSSSPHWFNVEFCIRATGSSSHVPFSRDLHSFDINCGASTPLLVFSQVLNRMYVRDEECGEHFIDVITRCLTVILLATGRIAIFPIMRRWESTIWDVVAARVERRRRFYLEPLMRVRRRLFFARCVARRWADRRWNPYTTVGKARLLRDYDELAAKTSSP